MQEATGKIGRMIYDLRIEQDIQQCELARAIGLHQSVLNRIEKGSRPARETEIVALARFFDVSTDYLLGISREKNSFGRSSAPAYAFPGKITSKEQEFLHKLQLLDERGRFAVITTLYRELEYSSPEKRDAIG